MYKVGQKINIGYYGGFHYQTLIKSQAEVTNVSEVIFGNLIEIKVKLSCGGYRKMFGYDYQIKEMENNFSR